ncbi:hypothetical protein QYF36_018896 [Acer negundo]|nr:hypothetical protein QYF36_018896 [Acer negundo]
MAATRVATPAVGGGAAVAMAAGAVAGATTAGIGNASLYVGDLEQNVNESQFCNAKEILNFTSINGKPIRIMYSYRDPSIRKSGYANVFIKNMDTSIDNKALHDTFSSFGAVLSCKVALDSNGQSKGYGFVQFENDEATHSAINQLNGMLLNDKQIYDGFFVRHQERDQKSSSPKFTNVYVNNLSETTTAEDLKKVFGSYGTITSSMKDSNGKSRCFGFVNFQSPDDAAAAVENLNGSSNGDKVWYAGRAQKRAERESELRAKFEQERISRFEKLKAANLYLKNVDDSINDEKLKELFSEFGTITSTKVLLDPQGQSKCSSLVAFSTPEEATKALNEMNGKMIGRKPLYVAVAQRKEERKARLQVQFTQLRVPGGMSPLPSGIPGYHPGAVRLGPQQLYYGQGTPGLISPQAFGYGFQQQMFLGMCPDGPNFMMPYHLQRQGQPGIRYMGNGVDPSVVSMMPMPFDASGMPVTPLDAQRSGSIPVSTLTSSLVSASPADRNRILGEQLYPPVESIEHVHASNVTGMLLEMDQTEVLHLIESPEALKTKVAEAIDVLQERSCRRTI